MARLAHFLVPGFPLLSGWLTRLGVEHGPQSESSSGNLFAPPGGDRRIEGGWRAAKHRPSILVAAGVALLFGGCVYALNRKGRRERSR
ncbi:short chain dehydrogenase [compost metagenome]